MSIPQGSGPIDTRILIPEGTQESHIQAQSPVRSGWGVWNRDPFLTPVQKNMIRNMFITGLIGVCFSMGVAFSAGFLLKPSAESYAISSLGISCTFTFVVILAFGEIVRKVFNDLNLRQNATS